MSRPAVSVVMPFAGDAEAAEAAGHALRSLEVQADDELLLVDNSGGAAAQGGGTPAIGVLTASRERSPAHARNVGAGDASADWILFLDADCLPSTGLLDAYFARPIAPEVGALAGAILPAPGGRGLVSRYGAERSFLDQEAHLAHPYRPRAAAANLLVRRRAFEELGGFFEGLRAAEDTDFSWRLQQAGWRLELRSDAMVTHRYRTTLGELRRQWRAYAAGRAWLGRRYPDFRPEPAALRAIRGGRRSDPVREPARRRSRALRAAFLALDSLLAVEELAGFTLSNRPPTVTRHQPPARVVVLADAFPVAGDPLVELASTLEGARVQATRRPQRLDRVAAERIVIDYLEDDGKAVRALGLVGLIRRHPLRCGLDLLRHRPGRPPLSYLAPAALRLERERDAQLLTLGGGGPGTMAGRIARLAGRKVADAG